MKAVLRLIAILLLLTAASRSNATLITIDHDWPINSVGDTGGYLTGILSVGDTVHVHAFYDTSAATFLSSSSSDQAFYSFPAGSAGVSFTVNGYTWATTGPIVVSVVSNAGSFVPHLEWLGYTSPRQAPDGISTTLSTPVNVQNVDNQFMLFLPQFPAHVIQNTSLPTTEIESQLTNYVGFNVGMVFVGSTDGTGYSFLFADPNQVPVPAPEPTTGLLILVGISTAGLIARGRLVR